MSRKCLVTQKKPMKGNHVSHANNKRKRRFLPNLVQRKFWFAEEERFVKLKLSTKGVRIIDKKGIAAVLKELKAQGYRF